MKRILLIIAFIAILIFLGITFYFVDKVYFLCPIQYKEEILIRSDGRGKGYFAASRNGRRIHEGIDLLAELATPVFASRSGKVIAATQNRGMGKYVIIRHSRSLITVYGHLSRIDVKKNDYVRQGDVIGLVGKTGNANSRGIQPHLHFEVRKDGIPQDPMEYLQ